MLHITDGLSRFCSEWARVFGSAVHSDFAPDSDVDVLVRYQPGRNLPEEIHLIVDRYMPCLMGYGAGLAVSAC